MTDNKILAPAWMLKAKTERSPVYFLDIRGRGLDLEDPAVQRRINEKLVWMLEQCAPEKMESPGLIKTHIGEPNAWQRIIPAIAKSSVEFLKKRGIDKIVVGDTTVVYSKGRGQHVNPPDNVEPYRKMASEHGWDVLGVPFVVLDRAVSSVPGVFEFTEDGIDLPTVRPNMFVCARVGGGAEAAGCIVNNVHLTGHGLAGVAMAVKGIAMGMADIRGKTTMHMAFNPVFDADICDRCGICATECPEGALEYPGDEPPVLDPDKCIGCGQCLAECPSGAIRMEAKKIENWARGADSFNYRLIDFFLGIMAGRWDRVAHVGHMVRITPQCDCMNNKMDVMCPDIGFVVAKNPFAMDRVAEKLLIETAGDNGDVRKNLDIHGSDKVYPYVEEKHGLATDYEIIDVEW